MDITLIEAIVDGGPVAVLAFLIFWSYRKDRKDSANQLSKIIDRDQVSREENTKAVTKLIVTLDKLNGKRD